MKKLVLAAAACLLSGAALAQTGGLSCLLNPTNPNCVCLPGENDADCTYGVHRGLVSATAIHESATFGRM